MCDFVNWAPGMAAVCVLCENERGGDDPPGPWMRHRPSHRRRVPIWAGDLPRGWVSPLGALGYLEYIDP